MKRKICIPLLKIILSVTVIFSCFGSVSISALNVSKDTALIPGGMPFGVKIYCEGILVVGVGEVSCNGKSVSPARDAGIREKDIICSANGVKLTEVSELTEILGKSGGNPVEFTVKRDGQEMNVAVTPVISEEDGKYKTGMLIRDSTAGIGTVTYIDKDSTTFGGLGHGICDADTGELLPLYQGAVVDVVINGVIKGEAGTPGELKGYFSSGKIGKLTGNRECGVYGVLSDLPSGTDKVKTEPIKIALSDEIKEGEVEILCTVDENGVGRYKAKISDIDHSGKSVKNFVVTITDEDLIAKTGGIVQGMSGSPIIQNGKLIGAVTHVMIGDPTRGYGIFIENMLAEAEKMKY